MCSSIIQCNHAVDKYSLLWSHAIQALDGITEIANPSVHLFGMLCFRLVVVTRNVGPLSDVPPQLSRDPGSSRSELTRIIVRGRLHFHMRTAIYILLFAPGCAPLAKFIHTLGQRRVSGFPLPLTQRAGKKMDPLTGSYSTLRKENKGEC
jgi:hypothetical protein